MLNPGFIKQLEEIVGEENILTAEDETAPHSYYTEAWECFLPSAVLFPSKAHQVADILRAANHVGVPVIPAGRGTRRFLKKSLSESLVLSTVKLNRIIEVDRGNMTAVAEPGVPLKRLAGALEGEGLFFPPYPHAFENSTLGGCAAIGAGGAAAPKYGVFKQHLLGMDFFLPSGEIMKLGAHTMKNVVGYDLTNFFCGSEGTLGVIGEMILRLLPGPPSQRLILGGFNSMAGACKAIQVLILSGTVPARVTVLDPWMVKGVFRQKESVLAWPMSQDWAAVVMCLAEGIEEVVAQDSEKMRGVLGVEGADDLRVVHDPSEIKECWRAQNLGLASLSRITPGLLTGDFTIPLKNTPGVIDQCLEVAKDNQLDMTWAGYHGQGIVHPVLLIPGTERDQYRRARNAFEEMSLAVHSAGGMISGPFPSVGIERAKFDHPVDGVNRDLMTGLKGLLDPEGIMKP